MGGILCNRISHGYYNQLFPTNATAKKIFFMKIICTKFELYQNIHLVSKTYLNSAPVQKRIKLPAVKNCNSIKNRKMKPIRPGRISSQPAPLLPAEDSPPPSKTKHQSQENQKTRSTRASPPHHKPTAAHPPTQRSTSAPTPLTHHHNTTSKVCNQVCNPKIKAPEPKAQPRVPGLWWS